MASTLIPLKKIDNLPTETHAINGRNVIFYELKHNFKEKSWYHIAYKKREHDEVFRIELVCRSKSEELLTALLPAPLFGRQAGIIYVPEKTKGIYLRIYSISNEINFTIETIKKISLVSVLKNAVQGDQWNFILAIGAFLINARKEFQQAIRFARSGRAVQEVEQWVKSKRSTDFYTNMAVDFPAQFRDCDNIKSLKVNKDERSGSISLIFNQEPHDSVMGLNNKLKKYYIFLNDEICGIEDNLENILEQYVECYPDVGIFIPIETIKKYEDQKTIVEPYPIAFSRFNFRHFPGEFNCIILKNNEYKKIKDEMGGNAPLNYITVKMYVAKKIEEQNKNVAPIIRPILIHKNSNRNKKAKNKTLKYKASIICENMNKMSFSVVIPTRDNFRLLNACVDSINCHEKHIKEIIIVDNGSRLATKEKYACSFALDSRVTIIERPGKFNFSYLCNYGAKYVSGDIVVFLNDDTELIEQDSLARLAQELSDPSLGVIGPCLLFPNKKIQHIGIVIGMGGIADHILHGINLDDPRYSEIIKKPREVSAITGACLAIRKSDFDHINGFDEINLPVECNDVDLCLRVRELGLSVIVDPRIKLIHHQSASRGFAWKPFSRYALERNYFQRRWKTEILNDPMFHPVYSLFSTTPMLDE